MNCTLFWKDHFLPGNRCCQERGRATWGHSVVSGVLLAPHFSIETTSMKRVSFISSFPICMLCLSEWGIPCRGEQERWERPSLHCYWLLGKSIHFLIRTLAVSFWRWHFQFSSHFWVTPRTHHGSSVSVCITPILQPKKKYTFLQSTFFLKIDFLIKTKHISYLFISILHSLNEIFYLNILKFIYAEQVRCLTMTQTTPGVGGFHLAEKLDSSLGLCRRFRRLELSCFKFFFEF